LGFDISREGREVGEGAGARPIFSFAIFACFARLSETATTCERKTTTAAPFRAFTKRFIRATCQRRKKLAPLKRGGMGMEEFTRVCRLNYG